MSTPIDSPDRPGRGLAVDARQESDAYKGVHHLRKVAASPGLICLAINLILGAFLFRFISESWTSSPYFDQWAYEGETLVRYFGHSLTWNYLWSQHNESHLVIPRLVALLYAPFTGWDVRFEVVLTFLCALLTSVGLCLLIVRNEALSRPQQALCLVITGASILSCTQWEVLLFGAYYFIVPGLCLVWALVLAQTRATFAVKVCSWILLSTLATLSYVNGVLLWFLLLPFLVIAGKQSTYTSRFRTLWAAAYCFIGSAVLWLYFSTYDHPRGHPALTVTVAEPSRMATYFLYWLGAPFSHVGPGKLIGAAAGFSLLLGFLLLSLRVWRIRPTENVTTQAYSWFVIGVYVMLTGASITFGRSGFGSEQAFASRYQSFSLLLPAILPPLACLAIPANLAVSQGRLLFAGTTGFVLGAATILFSLNYLSGVEELKQYGATRKRLSLAVEFINAIPDNPAAAANYPDPKQIPRICGALAPFHLPEVTTEGQQVVSGIRSVSIAGDGRNGFIDQVTDTGNGRLMVSGWAILKGKDAPADAVLFEWQGPGGSLKPITVVPVEAARPDVSQVLADNHLVNSGFVESISKANIPGSGILSAWAIDLTNRTAYQIGGTKPVSR